MSNPPSLDLITPCRNRVDYLRTSLSSWLACDQIQRIIVVDFNSTIPVIDDLGDLSGERVSVVRVENEPVWRQGRAQNIGLRLAQADLVLKTDADVATIDLQPYVERMAEDPQVFFKGFSKLGTSSGLCMAPRRKMKAAGGYHDHMSGWGGDDVDFYRRLKKHKLRHQFFQPESFREQGQRMAGKNSEAPRLDSILVNDSQRLASQPYFTGFRNSLLARIQRQNKRMALHWRYTAAKERPNLINAELKASCEWRLQLSRHSTELANILALAHYNKCESVWELMRSNGFKTIVSTYQLSRPRRKQERERLIKDLPQHLDALRELATSLGLELTDSNKI